MIGVPEGLKGPRATDFIAQLLQDLLGLNEKPLLDPPCEKSPKRGTHLGHWFGHALAKDLIPQ